jgi:hypothetical protein
MRFNLNCNGEEEEEEENEPHNKKKHFQLILNQTYNNK